MTPFEFRELFRQRTDTELLELCLSEDLTPYIFESNADAWDRFRDEIGQHLGVVRDEIRIVGSGRFGFSMKPGSNLRAFRDTSDIDVAIVNHGLFDKLWISMLEAAYPRPPNTERIAGWFDIRQKELYAGWLTPLDIRLDLKIFGPRAKPVLDFNLQWFNALKQASQHPPRRHEDVTGRLYRTWRHAELYHLHSLAALRRDLND